MWKACPIRPQGIPPWSILAVSSTVLLLLFTAVSPMRLYAEPTEDDQIINTLLRGLDYRLSLIRTIQGTATFVGSYSPTYAAKASSIYERKAGITYRERDLQRVVFAVDFMENKWDIQAIELFSSGYDPLAIVGEWGVQESAEEVPGRWQWPQSRCTSDGTLYRLLRKAPNTLGTLFIKELEPAYSVEGMLFLLKFHLLLTIGNISAGKYILESWETPTLQETEVLDGLKCFRLFDERVVDAGPTKQTVWIAPQAGFSLVKSDDIGVEKDNLRVGYRRVMEAREMRQFEDGIWLPSETVTHVYTYAENKENSWGYTRLVRLDDLRINERIDWDTANTAPPLGTMIYDLRREGAPVIWGDVDKILRSFESGRLEVPLYDTEAARPLTGYEFDHVF